MPSFKVLTVNWSLFEGPLSFSGTRLHTNENFQNNQRHIFTMTIKLLTYTPYMASAQFISNAIIVQSLLQPTCSLYISYWKIQMCFTSVEVVCPDS